MFFTFFWRLLTPDDEGGKWRHTGLNCTQVVIACHTSGGRLATVKKLQGGRSCSNPATRHGAAHVSYPRPLESSYCLRQEDKTGLWSVLWIPSSARWRSGHTSLAHLSVLTERLIAGSLCHRVTIRARSNLDYCGNRS